MACRRRFFVAVSRSPRLTLLIRRCREKIFACRPGRFLGRIDGSGFQLDSAASPGPVQRDCRGRQSPVAATPRRKEFGDALHGTRKLPWGRGDASNLHAEEFAEGPAGIVIGSLLRIVGAPVLVVEQGVGDAGVRLIHADDVAGLRENGVRWLRRFGFILGGRRLRFRLAFGLAFAFTSSEEGPPGRRWWRGRDFHVLGAA